MTSGSGSPSFIILIVFFISTCEIKLPRHRDGECVQWFMGQRCEPHGYPRAAHKRWSKAYLEAVEGDFGANVDYAQLVKMFGASPESSKGRYSPAQCTGIKKTRIEGDPDPKHISTSYVERSNLTVRMHNRRFTRLTTGFSKKLENHAYSVALFATYYNFCKIHKTLRVTPAMQAGVSDRVWDVVDIVKLVEDAEPKPGQRGPYKKKVCRINATILDFCGMFLPPQSFRRLCARRRRNPMESPKDRRRSFFQAVRRRFPRPGGLRDRHLR